MKVLCLDDDPEIGNLLQRYLTDQGMKVRVVPDAAALFRLVTREPFDVLVLDLNLPDEDGLQVCRRLREAGETLPVVMLTARADTVDRVVGLEMGADDYVVKPFDPRELVARLRAQVRARGMRAEPRRSEGGRSVRFGSFELFLDEPRLLRSGAELDIKPSEHALLRVLADNANRPLGRERLVALSRGLALEAGADVGLRSIDVQILRLRRLIEHDATHPRVIRTVWGVGYVFVPEASLGR